jgi:hypothetical protein
MDHTPIKPPQRSERILKLKSFGFPTKRYSNYLILQGLAIVLGSLLKNIYTLEADYIGRNSFITGFPIIRNYFFLFPGIITVLFFLQLILIFSHEEVSKHLEYSIIKFFHKTRFGYLFTNFILFLIFYIMLNHLYIPVSNHNGFKLSGHILACMTSGSMLINIQNIAENLKSQNIKKKLMDGIKSICNILLFHNLYTIVWTVWVFHHIREAVLSYIIAMFYTFFINSLNIDRLIALLINNKNIGAIKDKNNML